MLTESDREIPPEGKFNYVVESPLLVRWVVGSILHGRPVDPQRPYSICYLCLWDGAYKIYLAALYGVGHNSNF